MCEDTNAVAHFLANSSAPTGKLLLLLADILEPDAVPNEVGVDPWYLALQAVLAKEGSLHLELLVFGFRRALGRRSRSVGDLLKLTFEPLHIAAESGAFPEDQWRLLDRSLPWPRFGHEQERAARLCQATARKCSDLQLHADALVDLVGSDELFSKLLEEILEIWGGSRYLRSISDAIDRQSPRSRLLKQFIKQHSTLW